MTPEVPIILIYTFHLNCWSLKLCPNSFIFLYKYVKSRLHYSRYPKVGHTYYIIYSELMVLDLGSCILLYVFNIKS